MKNKIVLLAAIAAILTTSILGVYAGCFGKTKAEGNSDSNCGPQTAETTPCSYTSPVPSYDVCEVSKTDTGKICNTGPGTLSGVKTVTYNGTCMSGTCNSGVAVGEGTLNYPQPAKVALVACGG